MNNDGLKFSDPIFRYSRFNILSLYFRATETRFHRKAIFIKQLCFAEINFASDNKHKFVVLKQNEMIFMEKRNVYYWEHVYLKFYFDTRHMRLREHRISENYIVWIYLNRCFLLLFNYTVEET